VSTRTSETLLWLFLPYASAAGFVARFEHMLKEVMPKNAEVALKARVQFMDCADGLGQEDSADALMARLQAGQES
jgi:hypothetical protein